MRSLKCLASGFRAVRYCSHISLFFFTPFYPSSRHIHHRLPHFASPPPTNQPTSPLQPTTPLCPSPPKHPATSPRLTQASPPLPPLLLLFPLPLPPHLLPTPPPPPPLPRSTSPLSTPRRAASKTGSPSTLRPATSPISGASSHIIVALSGSLRNARRSWIRRRVVRRPLLLLGPRWG